MSAMEQSAITRRRLIQTTFAGTAAAALNASGAPAADEKGKTAPVRVAVMGVNGRGKQLLSTLMKFPEVEVTHVCDPDSAVIPAAVKVVTDAGRSEPAAVKDFRTALDDPKVDVLVCAAPDHWHALATVLACQAGKDVYVEKPASHNIVEGRRMVQAARKHGRVVQVGTQRRSGGPIQTAVDHVRNGKIGRVHFVRAWIIGVRPSIGKHPITDPPANLDFSLWAGPAVDPQYKRNLVHYHWHWRWQYGTGECGNNGVHMLDIARWGLGYEAPQIVSCGGNKYFFDDDQETPDTQIAVFDFKDCAIQWEHRTWSDRGIDGGNGGVVFYGTDGVLSIIDDRWTIVKGNKIVEKGEEPRKSEWEFAHLRNFLECRLTRDYPRADIEIAHRSTSLCHLANIAWRTRSTLRFDGGAERIVGNEPANALLGRSYRKGFELPEILG